MSAVNLSRRAAANAAKRHPTTVVANAAWHSESNARAAASCGASKTGTANGNPVAVDVPMPASGVILFERQSKIAFISTVARADKLLTPRD